MNKKEFNTIYKEIYNECYNYNHESFMHKSAQEQREKVANGFFNYYPLIVICFLGYFFSMRFNSNYAIYFFIALNIFAIAGTIDEFLHFSELKKKDNNSTYKAKVITSLISKYDNHLQYNRNKGISKEIYDIAEFKKYDIYISNDHVFGFLDGIIPIQFGNVLTQEKNLATANYQDHTNIFNGLFSVIKLPKNYQSTIKIRENSKKGDLQMDSQEFENYFDVFTSNKHLSMRILTSEIMNYMIELTNKTSIPFEITIKNSFMYIQMESSEKILRALSEEQSIDRDILYNDYKYITSICELNKKIFYAIQEKDI